MKKLYVLILLMLIRSFTGCSNSMRVTGVVRETENNEWVLDTGTCLYSIDSSLGNAYNNRHITVTGHTDGDTAAGPFFDIHYIEDVQ